MAERLATCGGCQGIGSHRRWCPAKVGAMASVYGTMSQRLESMGDTVGSNDMGLANELYLLSGKLLDKARLERAVFESVKQVSHG